MDQRHREYCIKLGNPYYSNQEETTYEKLTESSFSSFEIEVENNDINENWKKNTKKFTN